MIKQNIVFLDIETTNLKANFGYMLSYCWKKPHQKPFCRAISETSTFKKDRTNDAELVKSLISEISSAELLVTWYGKGFDVPFINTRALYHKQNVLPPDIPHLDGCIDVARRRLCLNSNRLQSAANLLLGKSEKTQLTGPHWIRAMAGYEDAIDYVKNHNIHDVLELEKIFNALKPLITTIPAFCDGDRCPHCGSRELTAQGTRRTKANYYYRYQCRKCGSWSKSKAVQFQNALRLV